MATVREYRGPRRIWHLLRHAGGWRQPFSIGPEPAIRPVRGQEQWPGVAAVRSCDCFPGQPARGSAEYLLNIAPIAESLFTAVEYITGISDPANFLNEPFLLRPKGYPASPPAQSQSAYPRLGRVAGRAEAVSCFPEHLPIRDKRVFDRACRGNAGRAAVSIRHWLCRLLPGLPLDRLADFYLHPPPELAQTSRRTRAFGLRYETPLRFFRYIQP